jgi:transcriptional regulator with XRE-family HTH domain
MPNSIFRTSLSSEIKRLRAKRKLSQAALAKASGVRQASISEIENGSGNPTLETIDALIKAVDARVIFRLRDAKD